jgi:putative peptidoglycan lipid II flippase
VIGSVLAVTMSFFVLIGVLFTPSFVDIVAGGFEGETRLLTIQIVRILFPGVGLLVLSAWCLGILNSHRRFFLSYVAPVFWNLAMIVALVAFGRSHSQNDLAIDLAWGSVVGSLLQMGVQLPVVFRVAGKIRPSLDLDLEPVRAVFRGVVPVLISRGVVQLSAFIDASIATYLGPAAASSLGYAQTLYLLPISLFGMAVSAAELPEMSVVGASTAEARQKLRSRLVSGRRSIAFFVIPSAVAFLFVGRAVVSAIYQTGRFGPEDTLYVWYILMGSVVGLLAATWGRLYSSAFYALGDTRTPLNFAIVRVTLTVGLGLLLAFPLRPWILWIFASIPGLHLPALENIDLKMGAVGLTASAGFAGWVEFLCLRETLKKRIGGSEVPFSFLTRVWGAALIAAAASLGGERFLPPEMRLFHYNLQPIAVLAIFGVVYLSLTALLRVEETKLFTRRLRLTR